MKITRRIDDQKYINYERIYENGSNFEIIIKFLGTNNCILGCGEFIIFKVQRFNCK